MRILIAELLKIVPHSFPVDAVEGMIVGSPTLNKLYYYNGTDWIDLTASEGTGLEQITEGGNTGLAKVGDNRTNKGVTGSGSVDLSSSFSLGTYGATGELSYAEGHTTQSSGNSSHAEGRTTIASGDYSHAENHSTEASGLDSHAEGYNTTSSGIRSHAEGLNSIASGDNGSHAEGATTVASGDQSHAEGGSTEASAPSSHAEGQDTTASGNYSHAEGLDTVSSNDASHAEGSATTASGVGSHSQGQYTLASGQSSHAGGAGTASFPVIAAGLASFDHQQVTKANIGAVGANSAILGGIDNTTSSAATGTVVLGGFSQDATIPNTAYFMQAKMEILSTLPTLTASDGGFMCLYDNAGTNVVAMWNGTSWEKIEFGSL